MFVVADTQDNLVSVVGTVAEATADIQALAKASAKEFRIVPLDVWEKTSALFQKLEWVQNFDSSYVTLPDDGKYFVGKPKAIENATVEELVDLKVYGLYKKVDEK